MKKMCENAMKFKYKEKGCVFFVMVEVDGKDLNIIV